MYERICHSTKSVHNNGGGVGIRGKNPIGINTQWTYVFSIKINSYTLASCSCVYVYTSDVDFFHHKFHPQHSIAMFHAIPLHTHLSADELSNYYLFAYENTHTHTCERTVMWKCKLFVLTLLMFFFLSFFSLN